jgi:hypothetical protein
VLNQALADPKHWQLKHWQVAAAKEKSVPYNAVLYLLNEIDAFDAHFSFSEEREVALRNFWDALEGSGGLGHVAHTPRDNRAP